MKYHRENRFDAGYGTGAFGRVLRLLRRSFQNGRNPQKRNRKKFPGRCLQDRENCFSSSHEKSVTSFSCSSWVVLKGLQLDFEAARISGVGVSNQREEPVSKTGAAPIYSRVSARRTAPKFPLMTVFIDKKVVDRDLLGYGAPASFRPSVRQHSI